MYKPKFFTKQSLATELDKTISRYIDDIEKLQEIRKEAVNRGGPNMLEADRANACIAVAQEILKRLYEQRERAKSA